MNYFRFVAEEARLWMAQVGVRSIEDKSLLKHLKENMMLMYITHS